MKTIGRLEWVHLPGLHPTPLQAKVDTGAATCVLHCGSVRVAKEQVLAVVLLRGYTTLDLRQEQECP